MKLNLYFILKLRDINKNADQEGPRNEPLQLKQELVVLIMINTKYAGEMSVIDQMFANTCKNQVQF